MHDMLSLISFYSDFFVCKCSVIKRFNGSEQNPCLFRPLLRVKHDALLIYRKFFNNMMQQMRGTPAK